MKQYEKLIEVKGVSYFTHTVLGYIFGKEVMVNNAVNEQVSLYRYCL